MGFHHKTTPMERLLKKVVPVTESGCWIWTGATRPNGYGCFQLDGKIEGAHRASFILHGGVIPSGYCVCHKCDTPACVNPDHLFVGTHLDNNRDTIKKGRFPDRAGEAAGHRKLTAEDVVRIRASDAPTRVLSDQFGVAHRTVRQIKTHASWRSVA